MLRWAALQARAGADPGKVLRPVDKLDSHHIVRRIEESRSLEQARTFLLGDPTACQRDWQAVEKARAANTSDFASGAQHSCQPRRTSLSLSWWANEQLPLCRE